MCLLIVPKFGFRWRDSLLCPDIRQLVAGCDIPLPRDRRAPGPFMDSCWLGLHQLIVGGDDFIVFHVYEACHSPTLGLLVVYYSANLVLWTNDSSTSL